MNRAMRILASHRRVAAAAVAGILVLAGTAAYALSGDPSGSSPHAAPQVLPTATPSPLATTAPAEPSPTPSTAPPTVAAQISTAPVAAATTRRPATSPPAPRPTASPKPTTVTDTACEVAGIASVVSAEWIPSEQLHIQVVVSVNVPNLSPACPVVLDLYAVTGTGGQVLINSVDSTISAPSDFTVTGDFSDYPCGKFALSLRLGSWPMGVLDQVPPVPSTLPCTAS